MQKHGFLATYIRDVSLDQEDETWNNREVLQGVYFLSVCRLQISLLCLCGHGLRSTAKCIQHDYHIG